MEILLTKFNKSVSEKITAIIVQEYSSYTIKNIESMSNTSENFGGSVFRLNLLDAEKEKQSLIVKIAENRTLRKQRMLRAYFKNEIFFYTEVY